MAQNRVYSTVGSSLLTVSMRWTDRAIGITSTLILARLLAPADFGIVAMGSLVTGLADTLFNFSVNVALIRDPDVTQEHYDSAWTIGLLQAVASALVLVIAAPLAADYFADARVTAVVRALAISVLLIGLQNVGMVQFQKNMQFGAEFRLLFLKRVVGFAAVVIAAATLRTYWALVIGTLVASATGTLLTYAMHPMRPRLSFKRFHEIFGVSQWMLVANIGEYLRVTLHKMLVGRWSSPSIMGAYSLADEISSLPSGELLAPIGRALFPAFASVKHDLSALKEKFLLAQGIQTAIAVPAAVGLAVVAGHAVPVLLGEKWESAVPFVQILALANIVQALCASPNYALIVVGAFKATVLFVWTQVLFFAALAVTLFIGSDAVTIASLRLGVAVVALWVLFWLVMRSIPALRVADLLVSTWRPLVSAAAMAAVVLWLSAHIDLRPTAALLVEVLVGAAVYAVGVIALWALAGRPRGAESYVFGLLRGLRPVSQRQAAR